jgi:hypothetical protein
LSASMNTASNGSWRTRSGRISSADPTTTVTRGLYPGGGEVRARDLGVVRLELDRPQPALGARPRWRGSRSSR